MKYDHAEDCHKHHPGTARHRIHQREIAGAVGVHDKEVVGYVGEGRDYGKGKDSEREAAGLYYPERERQQRQVGEPDPQEHDRHLVSLLLAEEVPDCVEGAGAEGKEKDSQIHRLTYLDQNHAQHYGQDTGNLVGGYLLPQEYEA